MQLFTNSRTPYGRKVRILAIEKSIDLELVICDLANKPEGLVGANPLTQIPTLVDGGYSVFDSPVICEYLDTKFGGPKFFPTEFKARFDALKIQAMADALGEFGIKVFFEKAKAPELQDEKVLIKFRTIIKNTIAELEAKADTLKTENITIAEAALGAIMGYVAFRLADEKFFEDAPKLNAWYAKISERPSFKQTEPKFD